MWCASLSCPGGKRVRVGKVLDLIYRKIKDLSKVRHHLPNDFDKRIEV